MTKHETIQNALADLLKHASDLEYLNEAVEIGMELLLLLEEHPEITVQVADKIERRKELLRQIRNKEW